MSVGVITAAVVIYFQPTWTLADPLCTYLFSIIIMCTSIPVFKDCVQVMMEGTPYQIELEKLEQDITDIVGVDELHDLHLWSISAGKYSMSCHIVSSQPLKTLHAVTDMCRRKHKLFHTTIQVEGPNESRHYFKCENDLH
jgi:zinc transporter 2